ncbi:MAG: serine hydrolase domain-containing protein [Planctomycetota bacterium]
MIATLLALVPALVPCRQDATRLAEDARIEAVVQKFMRTPGAVGLSVAVGRGEELVYERAQGFADLEFTANADPETMFRIGSVTKQFTAAAIMKLSERGKLSVDDPLAKFLPDYPRAGDITLRHLLTHTGGVPNYTDLGKKWSTIVARELAHEELVALWRELPLDFEPGTKWNYSNSGYYLLGMVIEKVAGVSYGEFLRETFFDPLKLTRTRYDSNGEVLLNRAQGYAFAEGKFWNDQLIGMSQPGAAGALISTGGDLVRWQIALVNGRAVKPSSYEEMTLPFLLTGGGETTYGLGLGLGAAAGASCVSHGGGIFGFNSFLGYWPDSQLSIAVISNSEQLRAEALALELAQLLLGKK